jgi:hypothetical protein
MKNMDSPKILSKFHLPEEKSRWIALMLIFGLWAVLQYSLGNQFLALFGILFILVFIFYRPKYFKFFAAIVLGVAFISSHSIDTWANLFQTNLGAAQRLQFTVTNILNPNSGRDVLPGKVQQILSLLGKNHIPSYRLSDQLAQDESIYQRIIETAWPIKKDETSFYLFCSIEEIKDYPGCEVMDKRKEIALVFCH